MDSMYDRNQKTYNASFRGVGFRTDWLQKKVDSDPNDPWYMMYDGPTQWFWVDEYLVDVIHGDDSVSIYIDGKDKANEVWKVLKGLNRFKDVIERFGIQKGEYGGYKGIKIGG